MLALAPLSAAPLHDEPSRHWYTLSADGVRTGYAYVEQSPTAVGTIEREVVRLDVRQLGHRSRVERSIAVARDAAGKSVWLEYETKAGTVHSAWHGKIGTTSIDIEPLDGHRGESHRVDLPDSTEISIARTHKLSALWKKQSTDLSYFEFDPGAESVVRVIAKAVVDPARPQFVHVQVANAATGTPLEDVWFDSAGSMQRLDRIGASGRVTWTPCQSACDADVEHPMDPMDHLVLRSPVWIPIQATHRPLRYVITRGDGIAPALVPTDEQDVVFDGSRAIVTVCERCGHGDVEGPRKPERYLQPNAWVRSDDTELRHLALATVSRSANIDWRMRKLADLVLKRMRGRMDFIGYADAVTALHTGSGDCTEFAVLFAALARAQGIPTRIAVGVAYSDHFSGRKNVFSPHMWVQAWNGTAWKSYDAALDGFDSTHIAFAVIDGKPDEVERAFAQLPYLHVDKAGVLRTP